MYIGGIFSLVVVLIIVSLFYTFHKRIPPTLGTVNVYLIVLFSFLIMQMLTYSMFLLVQTGTSDFFILLKESVTFAQDSIKIILGGLLGALLPLQRKENGGS